MNKEQYIKAVLNNLRVSAKIKRRIKEDLDNRIDDAFNDDPFYDITADMGTPQELASEFMEHFEKSDDTTFGYVQPYEYMSETKIFGIPLIHINTSGSSTETRVAKGIIALGDVAIGVVSAGGVSLGVFSAGGVALGGVALGGVALGGVALGGVAIGVFAIGAVAISIFKSIGVVGLFLK